MRLRAVPQTPWRNSRTMRTKIEPVMMPMPSKPDEASESSSWTTIKAPTGPPHNVPIPPRTVMRTTLPEVVQLSASSEANPCEIEKTPPARPARPAEMTKTTTL